MGVFALAWLYYNGRDVASRAIRAARDATERDQFGREVHEAMSRAQRDAIYAAGGVDEPAPGVRKAVYEYSMWMQQRLSSWVPGSVRPKEIKGRDAQLRAASFLMGAFIASLPEGCFGITDEHVFEKLIRQAMSSCLAIDLNSTAVEDVVSHFVNGTMPKDLTAAWALGILDVREGQRGIDPLPFDNKLREALA